MMEKRNCNGSAEIELRRLASSDPFKIEHFRVRDTLEIFVLENVIAVICDHYSLHFRDM